MLQKLLQCLEYRVFCHSAVRRRPGIVCPWQIHVKHSLNEKGKFRQDVREKHLSLRGQWDAGAAAQRSCGAPSLEALKAKLDGALGSWAARGQPCPWHGVGLGGLWGPFLPKPFCDSVILWFYESWLLPCPSHAQKWILRGHALRSSQAGLSLQAFLTSLLGTTVLHPNSRCYNRLLFLIF